MSRFDNIVYCTSNKYKKSVKRGDRVYIFETDELYEAKTIYKVHYVDEQKILVEVDPEKNKADLDIITGWNYAVKAPSEARLLELKKDKLYWWASAWLKVNSSFINNE